MKKILFVTLLFFPNYFFAQNNLVGYWTIYPMLGNTEYDEYFLYYSSKLESNTEFKADSTFLNWPRDKGCGNECYATNSGKYKWVDENHIQFILNHVSYNGPFPYCKEKEIYPNKDLGLFVIFKDSLKLRLIKSNGDSEADKQKLANLKLIYAIDKEAGKVFGINYLQRKRTKADTVEEIVSDYLTKYTKIKMADVKIIFTKNIHRNYLSILLEENNKYRYIVYDPTDRDLAMYDNGL